VRWKTKAHIQRIIGALPNPLREPLYYLVQRHFGAFRSIEPWSHLTEVGEMAGAAARHGVSPAGATVFDVGTGHRLLLPLAWWLLGARRVLSVDVHRYLRPELVRRDLTLMSEDVERVTRALSSHGAAVDQQRVDLLMRGTTRTLSGALEELPISYVAPADAGATHLPDGSVDIHSSRSVFEHVPPKGLKQILTEARRISTRRGVLVHLVDFSDHFSAVDSEITTINFLRFSEKEWARLAGNQFAYHNRLRSDDFELLFSEELFEIVESSYRTDVGALDALQSGFPISRRFRGKRPEDLARTRGLYVLSRRDAG
jgi:hypothetical protein